MSRINKSQYAILGWLSKGPMSGYDLKQQFAQVTPFHWSESNAQIYPILKKLEQDGLVSSRLDESSGARNRRIYIITSEGLDKLEDWLKQPVEPAQQREELLLKLTMGEHLDNHSLKDHIEHYHTQIKQQLSTLKVIESRNLQQNNDTHPYFDMIIDFAKMTLRAKDQWCQHVLSQLAS
jgi:PadR family transcriptional regulator AphA